MHCKQKLSSGRVKEQQSLMQIKYDHLKLMYVTQNFSPLVICPSTKKFHKLKVFPSFCGFRRSIWKWTSTCPVGKGQRTATSPFFQSHRKFCLGGPLNSIYWGTIQKYFQCEEDSSLGQALTPLLSVPVIFVIDYIYPHLTFKLFLVYFICDISKPFPDNHFIPLSSFCLATAELAASPKPGKWQITTRWSCEFYTEHVL